MAEKIDLAIELLEMFRKISEAFKKNELTAEEASELSASAKLIYEMLQSEDKDRVILVETLNDAKEKIIAETSVFFKEEIKKIVDNLQNTINQKLNLIPSADNLTKAYIYEKLTGGKII
jgi:hypothetical protein